MPLPRDVSNPLVLAKTLKHIRTALLLACARSACQDIQIRGAEARGSQRCRRREGARRAHTASDAGEEKVEVPATHASGAVKREL